MIHSEIQCDSCGQVAPFCGEIRGRWRAHAVRSQAQAAGWRVNLYGGRDLCPRCANGRARVAIKDDAMMTVKERKGEKDANMDKARD